MNKMKQTLVMIVDLKIRRQGKTTVSQVALALDHAFNKHPLVTTEK